MKEEVGDERSMNQEVGLWRRLVEFQIRYRRLLCGLILLGTVFFLYQIFFRLTIATDFFDLYPPKHPYIQLYKQYRKMFGSANILTLILEVKEGDIYQVETIAKMDRMTRAVLKMDGVNPLQVISLTHPKLKHVGVGTEGLQIRPLMWPKRPETEEALLALKNVVYSNEGVRGVYVSPDDKATLLHVGYWEEGVDLKNLFREMKALQQQEEDDNHSIYLTGYPILYAWIAHYGIQIYMDFGVTILVMLALLVFYFST